VRLTNAHACLLVLPPAVHAELQHSLWPRMLQQVAQLEQDARAEDAAEDAGTGVQPAGTGVAMAVGAISLAATAAKLMANHFQPLLQDIHFLLQAQSEAQQEGDASTGAVAVSMWTDAAPSLLRDTAVNLSSFCAAAGLPCTSHMVQQVQLP